MQSFPLKFANYVEQSDADSLCQCDIVSDFKTARRCHTSSTILQRGLSAGEQKFPLILE